MTAAGKPRIGPLEGDGFRLRLLQQDDLPQTLSWRNRDDVRFSFLHREVISPAQHQTWWERYRERTDDLVFIIEETRELCRPVGQIALYDIDLTARRAQFGRLMIGDPEARRRGLAARATARLADEAFQTLSLDHLWLNVLETNHAAISLYRAAGFTESARHGGVLQMTLLRDVWERARA